MIKGDLNQRYASLKAKVEERKADFDMFVKMLETETSWLRSPASTRFHLNEEKGLLKHSVAVAEYLTRAALLWDCFTMSEKSVCQANLSI